MFGDLDGNLNNRSACEIDSKIFKVNYTLNLLPSIVSNSEDISELMKVCGDS